MEVDFTRQRDRQGSKRGDLTGPNPTDRAKRGVKRHVLTDGRGVPLAVEISGANVHDKWRVEQTLDGVVLRGSRGLHSLAVSAVGRGAGLSSARTLGTTSSAHDSCGGNERDRGISGWFILRARSSRSSRLDDFPDRAFAVLMELVRIAESSLASRISEAISAPCISSGSARRNQYSDSRISLRATAILWMKSARLSPPRASSSFAPPPDEHRISCRTTCLPAKSFGKTRGKAEVHASQT